MHEIRHPLPEALSASLTLKRPFAAVNPLMILESGELLEGPPTLRAGIGLLVSVIEHVLVERLLECEGTATDVALVGGLSWKEQIS